MPLSHRAVASALVITGLALLAYGCSLNYRKIGGYHFDATGIRQQRSLEGNIDLGVRRIAIENRHGDVIVEAVAGAGDWRWDLSVWGRTQSDADQHLQDVTLEVLPTSDGKSWRLVVPPPPVKTLRGWKSDLRLRVPAGVVVRVDNSFGETAVTGVHGRTEVYSTHGPVKLAHIGGPVVAHTSFDPIHVSHVGPADLKNQHGQITVNTVTGDLIARTSFDPVEIQQVRGKLHVVNEHGDVNVREVHGAAEIHTTFGMLEAADVRGAALLRNEHGGITARALRNSVNARSSFGDIHLEADGPEISCQNEHGSTELVVTRSSLRSVVAVNSFGSLNLAVPAKPRPRIHAKTSFGTVHSDVPVTSNLEAGDPGDGIPRVSLRNKHGDIRVTCR